MGKIIIGVDPGVHGAIAFLPGTGTPYVFDMPTTTVQGSTRKHTRVEPAIVAQIIETAMIDNECLAVVELVHAMPGQGVSSMFSMGESTGMILGVLAALRIPHTRANPSVWKKQMSLGRDKEASRAMALQLWPELARDLSRKKDEGRAEALLMAEHFRRVTGALRDGRV